MTNKTNQEASSYLRRALALMAGSLLLFFALAPSALTWYLHSHTGSTVFAKAPNFHVAIITLAILFSAFVSYVTWQSYRKTGKPFERWLLLGMLGFTVIYAPHGFLTNIAGDNIWLFILYGPASRLVMGGCFLMAVLNYGHEQDDYTEPERLKLLTRWLGFCLLLCIAIAALALSPIAGERYVRWSMEWSAIATQALCLGVMVWRRINSQIMVMFGIAVLLFMQSSFAFLFPKAWSHTWWYAHLIFAGGFGLLSYQIAVVFRSTGSFESVYSQEELLGQVQEANANYQRSNDELSRFAHLVSHDLKAPLMHMTNFIDLLLKDIGPTRSENQQKFVDIINKNASQMRALIEGLLQLSSIQQQALKTEAVDLNKLVNEVSELFKGDLQKLGASLQLSPLPTVEADPALLFQVFQNLIQNAIKYRCPERALHIDISASQQGGDWRIAVADNGMGFEAKDKHKAFAMMGRLHSGKISGTGAGLAICSKIIQRHGGHIDVEAAPDQGATFYIHLPG